eukprot:PhM_4_TR8691/c0_g2_i1/m.80478
MSSYSYNSLRSRHYNYKTNNNNDTINKRSSLNLSVETGVSNRSTSSPSSPDEVAVSLDMMGGGKRKYNNNNKNGGAIIGSGGCLDCVLLTFICLAYVGFSGCLMVLFLHYSLGVVPSPIELFYALV